MLHGGSFVAKKLTNGISFPPESGVVADEFWVPTDQPGRWVPKKDWKWRRTLREFSVPGTRGMRIGARMAPVWILKSESAGRGRRVRPAGVRGWKVVGVARGRRRIVVRRGRGLIVAVGWVEFVRVQLRLRWPCGRK